MFQKNSCFVTTSIGYGEFQYYNRYEHESIGKTPIYGSGFVEVYIDNEKTHPKLLPSACRIIKKNLPPEVKNYLESNTNRFYRSVQHFYFYWMVDTEQLHVNEIHTKFLKTAKKVKSRTNNITSKYYQQMIEDLFPS